MLLLLASSLFHWRPTRPLKYTRSGACNSFWNELNLIRNTITVFKETISIRLHSNRCRKSKTLLLSFIRYSMLLTTVWPESSKTVREAVNPSARTRRLVPFATGPQFVASARRSLRPVCRDFLSWREKTASPAVREKAELYFGPYLYVQKTSLYMLPIALIEVQEVQQASFLIALWFSVWGCTYMTGIGSPAPYHLPAV